MAMKDKILARLSDAEDFVSGQQLCSEFGVSRTAVWKAVNRLKKEGYNIESVTNRGYRLREGNDILSESEMQRFMKSSVIGRKVIVYDECDSTNTRASQAAFAGEEEGLVIVSNRQTSGRGRRGRVWNSPEGVSVYMSILLRPKFVPGPAPRITLVAALAVAYAIDDLIEQNTTDNTDNAAEKTRIKWPNDILIDEKKVCGILSEIDCQIDHINHLVVGIGINVLNRRFPSDIADKAGSIYSITGQKLNRNRLVVKVCEYFEKFYSIFQETESIENLADKYNSKLINKDRGVVVLDSKGDYEGIARGVNNEGSLMVEIPGGMKFVSYGEVSVRGLNGYI